MPPVNLAHQHDAYISFSGWLETVLRYGPDAVDDYLAEAKEVGFDVIESLPASSRCRPGLLWPIERAKKAGRKTKPELGIQFGSGGDSTPEELAAEGKNDVGDLVDRGAPGTRCWSGHHHNRVRGRLAPVHKLRRADLDNTLIDRHIYNTFQPLLHQVATAVWTPATSSGSRVHCTPTSATAVPQRDRGCHGPRHRCVQLNSGTQVNYDQLVIAAGVITNFFGFPGAAEHARPLYRRSQALRVRDELFARLEDAGQSSPARVVAGRLRDALHGRGPGRRST